MCNVKNELFKDIPRLIYSASRMNKEPFPSLQIYSSGFTVQGTRCSHFWPFETLSTQLYGSSPIYPSLHLFSPFHPLGCFLFYFFDRVAGCIVLSQCLASPHVQTFLGNYKQPSQPREAFVDSLPVCINIYQARKQRQMSAMRRFLRVARW